MGEDASAEVAADNILVTCAAPGRILTSRTEVLDRAAAEKTGRPIEQIRAERVVAVPLEALWNAGRVRRRSRVPGVRSRVVFDGLRAAG